MPSEPEKPPSYAQSHDPQTLHLPSVPNTEVPDFRHERRLPPLPPLPLDKQYRQADVLEPRIAPSWPSSNPLTAYYQPSPAHASPMSKSSAIADSPSGMDIDVATPDSRGRRGGSVLSIDDPDVRLAAEALGDLRAGSQDFFTTFKIFKTNNKLQILLHLHLTNTILSLHRRRHRSRVKQRPNLFCPS